MSDCEPLRGKKQNSTNIVTMDYDFFSPYDVASAVRFYKRYRDDIQQFYRDNSKDIDVCILYEEYCSHPKTDEEFNDWLFDYCFSDVIEK